MAKKQLTLNDFTEWNESLMYQLKEKTRILYFMLLNQAASFIKNISIDFLLLKRFVFANSGYKPAARPLKNENAYREALDKLLPVLRQNPYALFLDDYFSMIFDESLKDHIDFLLQFDFNVSTIENRYRVR